MPRATLNVEQTERHDLKSLPADDGEDAGFVEIKKLSYGQILKRRDMAAKMAVENIPQRGVSREEDMRITTELVQTKVTEFEFRHCIVDHNLEDDKGKKLNFRNPEHIWSLDPRVGQEIGQLIDDLNNMEDRLEGKDSTTSEEESEPA